MIRAPQHAPDHGAELRATLRALSRSAPELHRLAAKAGSTPPTMTAQEVEDLRAAAGRHAGHLRELMRFSLAQWHSAFGLPADAMPTTATEPGRA
jgi:hypothetical protein